MQGDRDAGGGMDLFYEDYEWHDEKSGTRRSRRRRRHGKKQGAPVSPHASSGGVYLIKEEMEVRGSPLTLEQLGIYMPPNPAPKKNVVTWSDLDIGGNSVVKGEQGGDRIAKRAYDTPDLQTAQATQMVSVGSQQRPAGPLITASPVWHQTELPLLGSSPPPASIGVTEVTSVPNYQVPVNAHNHAQMQNAATWADCHSPAIRHWPCVGQYGFEASGQHSLHISRAVHMPLPAPPPPVQPAPGCTLVTGPAVATAIAPAPAEAPVTSESAALDTVLRNLAADAYED